MTRAGEQDLDPAALTLAEALQAAPPRPTLVWGGPLAPLADSAPDWGPARLFTTDLLAARAVQAPAELGVLPSPGDEPRLAALMPRSKEELAVILDVARARLGPGDQLWLAGHQRDGIKSAAKLLEAALGPVDVAHLKRHCRVLVATRGEGERAPEPTLDALEARFEADTPFGRLTCVTLPGTFAHGRLDAGTARLLPVLREFGKAKRILDLGAGCGVIGASYLLRRPDARVDLLDVSAPACESARRTLAANGFTAEVAPNAKVHLAAPEDLPAQPFYDLIVTNPPFHQGRDEDRTLFQAFAAAAAKRLARGGAFVAVANRHLAYGPVLEAAFRKHDVLFEDGSYRVWRAHH